jgi:hypothetical protein
MTAISALAASRVTPEARRPYDWKAREPVADGFAGSIVSGVNASGSVSPIRNPGGRDTDDREGPVRYCQLPAENARITTEPALPETVAEDDHLVTSGTGLFLRKPSSQYRTEPEYLKELQSSSSG